MRVLLVEDDDDLAAALAAALPRHGIAADRARTVEAAAMMVATIGYAVILLDLGLPDQDGMVLLRRLRAAGDAIPVIVVSARGRTDDRVTALNAGADDYLVKTFDVQELVARIHAVTRRGQARATDLVDLGNARIDLATGMVTVAGKAVQLSAREAQVGSLLFRRIGRVVPRSFVEEQLFGTGDAGGPNAIEVYVHRLRRKLAQAGAGLRVETVRGIGYMALVP